MSSLNTPCAACKFQRRKCTQECVFAPNFPPDQPQRFINVHKVFGASNVAKLLNELSPAQREDAVNSLSYEAELRLTNPIYGCVGIILFLQQRLKQVQTEVDNAKTELASYIGPSAGDVPLGYNAAPAFVGAGTGDYNVATAVGPSHIGGVGGTSQQQLIEAQQLAAMEAMKEEQEMMRSWEQQQHQFARFNGGGGVGGFCGSYEMVAAAADGDGGSGYAQMQSPELALGASTFDPNDQNCVYSQLEQQQQRQHQENVESLGQLSILQQPETSQQQQQQHEQQEEVCYSSRVQHLIHHRCDS
ncbi:hypothetical protein vseg_019382 [Gypsophila vaccaria]